jgi:hypothetical protein
MTEEIEKPLNDEEVAAQIPKFESPEESGAIAAETERGITHNHLLALEFPDAASLNKWFQDRKDRGYFAVQIFPRGSVIVALVQQTMTKEQEEELDDFTHEYNKFKEQRQEEKRKAKEAQELAELEAEKKEAYLKSLGIHCRDNHGSVIKDNDALKKEVKALKKKLAGK